MDKDKNIKNIQSEKVLFDKVQEYFLKLLKLNPSSGSSLLLSLMELVPENNLNHCSIMDFELLKNIVNQGSIIIYAVDKDGRFLFANKEAVNYLNIDLLKDVKGKKREDFISKSDADEHFKNDISVFQTKKPMQTNKVIIKNDIEYYYLVNKFPIFDNNNNVFAVGSISYDISEQVKKEKQIAISEEIFHNGQSGILVCDEKANIISVNNVFEKITGYKAEECIGKNPKILASNEKSYHFYENMSITLKGLNNWKGEVWNKKKTGEAYIEELSISTVKDSKGNVVSFLIIFNDITDKKKSEEEIDKLSFYDPLTGAANRELFKYKINNLILQYSKNTELSFSLIHLDLDNFKEVNDVYGHYIGDELLKKVSQRISSLIRNEDVLARMGGDEFSILINDIGYEESVYLGNRLIKTISQPYVVNDNKIIISASIGITLFPDFAMDYDSLLKSSDISMYEAKRSGKNQLYVFEKHLEKSLVESVNIENELRHAIERNELYLVYQPQYSIKKEAFVGVETLIRWKHPVMGNVSPVKFIPIAERSDLITDITNWVIGKALTDLQDLLSKNKNLSLSINFSPKDFFNENFSKIIKQKLLNFPMIMPQQLEIEITERLAMENSIKTLKVFDELRDIGVTISLDDFGTGYSSMSYLNQYPIQVLKIDKTFVDEIGISRNGESICKMIILLSKSIGYKTIAEGAETIEQVEFLKEQGCDIIQGYFYSKPLPINELVTFLK